MHYIIFIIYITTVDKENKLGDEMELIKTITDYKNEKMNWTQKTNLVSSTSKADRLKYGNNNGSIFIDQVHGYTDNKEHSRVYLTKEDALKLAKTITEHYNEYTEIVEQSFYAEDTSEQDFDDALQVLLDGIKNNYNGHRTLNLTIKKGRKFLKIMSGSSCWGFVSLVKGEHKGESLLIGDVLKPATWRAPAKYTRGNIFNTKATKEQSYYTWCGPNYLN